MLAGSPNSLSYISARFSNHEDKKNHSKPSGKPIVSKDEHNHIVCHK